MPIILYALMAASVPIAAVIGFKTKTAAVDIQQAQQQKSSLIDLAAYAAAAYLAVHMLKKVGA